MNRHSAVWTPHNFIPTYRTEIRMDIDWASVCMVEFVLAGHAPMEKEPQEYNYFRFKPPFPCSVHDIMYDNLGMPSNKFTNASNKLNGYRSGWRLQLRPNNQEKLFTFATDY